MKFKALLCCERTKPYLFNQNIYEFYESKYITSTHKFHEKQDYLLNGKIVTECDFEVEEIEVIKNDDVLDDDITVYSEHYYQTEKVNADELLTNSDFSYEKLDNYLKGNTGYAIHINNLHIFDEPKELSYCFTKKSYKDINEIFTDEIMIDRKWYRPVNKVPKNMMRVKRILQEDGILIPVTPEEMCRIANGEQTTLVRKKVLKEVIK